jgi:hypothetical protein
MRRMLPDSPATKYFSPGYGDPTIRFIVAGQVLRMSIQSMIS